MQVRCDAHRARRPTDRPVGDRAVARSRDDRETTHHPTGRSRGTSLPLGAAGCRRDRCAIWTLIDPGARSGSLFRCSWLPVHARCRWRHRRDHGRDRPACRRGVLITRGHTLETLAHATHFVFDKTGTLTHGRYELLDVKVVDVTDGGADEQRQQCLAWAAALESTSEHPIARALRNAAPRGEVVHANDVVNHPGCGRRRAHRQSAHAYRQCRFRRRVGRRRTRPTC